MLCTKVLIIQHSICIAYFCTTNIVQLVSAIFQFIQTEYQRQIIDSRYLKYEVAENEEWKQMIIFAPKC